METGIFLGMGPSASEPEVHDVLIIGGGPAGSTAALYAARAGLDTLVLDKGLTTGALGLCSRIANYPGIPGEISGAELLSRMRSQAVEAGASFVQEKVLLTALSSDPKEAHTAQSVYRARTVIIATGAMGRANPLPGEERLLGRGVSYCAVCDGAFFRDQDVAVVGNNDEALEEALYLSRLARRVYILSPTSDLRASAEIVEEVATRENIEIRLSHRVREILGDALVQGLRVTAPGSGEQILAVSAVFLYLQGNVPITDFIQGELPTTESGCLVVDEDLQTAIPGVFAVGDVLCTHLKQVVVAAAEGAQAALAAERFLRGAGGPKGARGLRPDWR